MKNRMRQIQTLRPGGAEVLRVKECDIPHPGEGEVLIQVGASGINRPDILGRMGLYPPPPGESEILGLEVAGRIVECGPGSGWNVGEEVCALVGSGGYAEYCVAPAGQCLKIPKGISLEEAAGIPENFFTVWHNVFQRGKLKAGEKILIHGGAGGIGITAIQLASLWGAQVFTTVGRSEKIEPCLKAGAHSVIVHSQQDFVREVHDQTGGKGVDVILDIVGGSYFERNLQILALEGRLVQIAFMQGAKVELDLKKLMAKRHTITGSTLRPQSRVEKGRIAQELRREVWPLFESGKVKVYVDQIFSFDEAAEAHRKMEKSDHVGKLILKP